MKARSLENETRNGERNANLNAQRRGDFIQQVKIEISVSHGTKSNRDFDWI